MANIFVCSAAAGTGAGTSWVNACTSFDAAEALPWTNADTIYVHNTHSKSYGAATILMFPTSVGMRILCVDGGDAAFTSAGASMGTTVGTLRTGAVESSGGGNFNMAIEGFAYIHGVRLQPNDGGARTGVMQIGARTNFDYAITAVDCIFSCNSSSTSPAAIQMGGTIGNAGQQRSFTMIGGSLVFGNVGQLIVAGSGHINLIGITTSGTAPTTMIQTTSGYGVLTASGCDFSAATNVLNVAADDTPSSLLFTNCKIGTPTTGTHPGPGAVVCEFHACAPASASDYTFSDYKLDASGVIEDDTGVYKTTGGAQSKDEGGTATSYSLKMVPNSTYVSVLCPLYTPWISTRVASTGSKTIAVEIATTAATLTQQDVWMEIEYMGTSGIPTSILAYDAAASLTSAGYLDVTIAGSARTDLAVDGWTGLTSEYEYSLSKAVTINNQGYVRVRVGLQKNQTIYVDPKISVT